MQLTNLPLVHLQQDLHSKKLPIPFILTHSEPKVVQIQEHTAGANELINTVMGKDLELIILKKDDKKGIESILFFLCSG